MKGYRMTNQTKKIANMAVLVAVAMIFSYVESLIPINFGVPGMKLGIANLVTVTGLYFLAVPEVLAVVAMRVLLTGFLFGNGMSIIYSLAGGLLSVLGHGWHEEAERVLHYRNQHSRRNRTQYWTACSCSTCCGELEVSLLSSGIVSCRRGDRDF